MELCFILKRLLVLLADNLHNFFFLVQVCLVVIELWYCGILEKGLLLVIEILTTQTEDISKD